MIFRTGIDLLILLQIWILQGTFSFNLSTVDANAKPSVSPSTDFPPKNDFSLMPISTTTEILTNKISVNGSDDEHVQTLPKTKLNEKNSTNDTFNNVFGKPSTKSLNTFHVFSNETKSLDGGKGGIEDDFGRGRSFNEETDETSNVTLINCTSGIDQLTRCNYSFAENGNDNADENTALSTMSSVAAAAGFCLASAIVGYFGCVGYRRYMQRKYENTKIEAAEDVYDTTDLRYFEI